MRRAVTITLIVLVAALVAAQFLIPVIAENQLAGRLVKDGGTATVSLSAFPAITLLWESGDSLEIHASGLEAELDTNTQVFKKLDNFNSVDIDLTDVTAGPVNVKAFHLEREGDEPYHLTLSGSGSPRDLSEFAADQLAGPLGDLAQMIPLPDVDVPVEVDATIESDGGNLRLVSGAGTVAGIPAGPIVASITAAVVSRIGL
ncbi:MAG: hypothetical protein QOG62_1129 [Thermoleophilaceae bacterium]|jgi:hypothetical protein|nr:hypothetical protein [Thermoleophilaceae bacterium]